MSNFPANCRNNVLVVTFRVDVRNIKKEEMEFDCRVATAVGCTCPLDELETNRDALR